MSASEWKKATEFKRSLLNRGYSDADKTALAGHIVEHFLHAVENSRWPSRETERIFGLVRADQPCGYQLPGGLSTFTLPDLLHIAWKELHKDCGEYGSNTVNKTTIVQAILDGELPEKFQEWVVTLDREGISIHDGYTRLGGFRAMYNAYVRELVGRNVWDRIPWDFELLTVMCIKPTVKPAPSISWTTHNQRVVWLKVSKNKDAECCSAVKENLVERSASERNLMEFVSKQGWIRFNCLLLESLGEHIALFAEPSLGLQELHHPRNNIAATYMTCDVDGRPASTILGKALMVRRGGGDVLLETVERLCYFVDMYVENSIGTKSPSVVNQARVSWARYCRGDKLSCDGALSKELPSDDAEPTRELVSPGAIPMAEKAASHSASQNEEIDDACSMQEAHTENSQGVSSQAEGVMIFTVLAFSRNPAELHDLFQKSEAMSSRRAILEEEGLEWRLKSGAYIFVPPYVYTDIIRQMEYENTTLSPGHVIVLAEDEEAILSMVMALPRKYKINLEFRHSSGVLHASDFEDKHVEHGEAGAISVQRTFLHVKINSSLRSEPSSGPRTVSTTQTSLSKGENPRKFVSRVA